MRQQRCGYNPYVDAVCHSFDGRTAFGPEPPGTYVNASGGWHDAGDQLKYLLTSSNATAQMLLAYQLAKPRAFADNFNNLGQPGANSTPDILDEALWGLTWMLRLHPKPDQLYHQVADDRDHKGFRLPQNETVDYGWDRAVTASSILLTGSRRGCASIRANRMASRTSQDVTPPPWRSAIRSGKTIRVCVRLRKRFRATREARYLRDARRYALLARDESWMGKEEAGHYQYYPFMNIGHFRLYDLVDARAKRQLANFYREQIERCLKRGEANPYRIGVPFIWCSNNLVVALATQALLYERMTGDKRYRQFTANHVDWLLGRNPWGISMFTGIPAEGVYPKDVHLFTNALMKKIVRGGLVDGPVYRKVFQSLRGVSIREPDPLAAFQDERAVYHDDINDYSMNEPTMDGTASAILLWALK